MKKRIFAALSAMLMLLALAGCGAKQMDYDAASQRIVDHVAHNGRV